MDSQKEIIDSFDPISLQEMDDVRLQDRMDTKYLLNDDMLTRILPLLQKDYFILEVSGSRFTSYETLYFDTENFELYLKHHNERLNRYKIRSRTYVESGLHFFEVKFKNMKGRTIKERIKRNELVTEITSNQKASDFLVATSGIAPESLKPALWVNYRRMTLVNKHAPERLTIDTHLCFKDDDRVIPYTGLVIAEVKRGSVKDKSPFVGWMHRFHVREQSVSKYCLGVISLHPEVKRNRFKPVLLYIQKLLKAS